jgi:hypothetical protein
MENNIGMEEKMNQAIREMTDLVKGQAELDKPGPQMSYLLCPYTHEDKEVVKTRVELANVAASVLIKEQDRIVFSPLSHSHSIQEAGILVETPELWHRQDDFFLDRATEMVLLCLKGWDTSEGIRHEIYRGVVDQRKPLFVMVPIVNDGMNKIEFIVSEIVIPWHISEWVVKTRGYYVSAIIEVIGLTIAIIQETGPKFQMTNKHELYMTKILNIAFGTLEKEDPTRLVRSRPDITYSEKES